MVLGRDQQRTGQGRRENEREFNHPSSVARFDRRVKPRAEAVAVQSEVSDAKLDGPAGFHGGNSEACTAAPRR